MTRRLGFSGGAVMAADAIIDKIGVVHFGHFPIIGAVAGAAFVCGLNMADAFTHGDLIVMAITACTPNLTVHNLGNGSPFGGTVTGFATIGCGHMVRRFAVVGRTAGHVAADTIAGNAGMVKDGGFPWRARCMAGTTFLRGCDMPGIFSFCLSSGAVVATTAGSARFIVVKMCIRERPVGYMARHAIIAGRHMAGTFALGFGTVVA